MDATKKIKLIIAKAEISDTVAAKNMKMPYQVFKNYKGGDRFKESHYELLAAYLSNKYTEVKEYITRIEINQAQENSLNKSSKL